ncbi:MAG: phosphoribosylformylglycinamidine synthase subunit PurL [Candidatus Altiarchaeota archaeon]|nr:phosphoribosylformylglycinamidine synthase subunit PurL [Candidatus Altiarchaeota archaeon]
MKMSYRRILDNLYEISILKVSDSELETVSRDRSLGLSLYEMRKIRGYFNKEGRNPTDVELEAIAQSWSEHCCYKTSKSILDRTIFKIKAPQSICADDAGVVEFDREHAYVVALESHNHPSALDPYGGSATGIGGILRDVVCMGAQPIALVDPLFFGPLNYPENKLPSGTKHPRFIFKGVVSGIADYGNRVGIPTLAGMIEFDDSYTGNCLVNVGCIGIVRRDKVARSRAGNVGDIYILAGGKTGRDGIHGVTFASAELGEESEGDIPAVQLGYAIMKEPLIHACLKINEKNLLTGMKDLGGGGLSCVSGEMAYAGGKGAVVHLDKIPLKEEGMSPWEIWVSESQERMMLSVKPKDVDEVLGIFNFWDVPATVVGEVNDSERIKVFYNDEVVLDLDLEFLIEGIRYERPYRVVEREEAVIDFSLPDLKKVSLELMGSPRIGSRESVIRRYDHEVRASTILKPMQGVINKQSHGDATVIKPLRDSFRGLAVSCDVNPLLCRLNPYWGAAGAVDEVVRNLVSVNSIPHSLTDCLNFGNPEKEDILGDFIRCCEGLYFAANTFKLPFISGNVSFYNESSLGPIAPTPALMGVGIVGDVRKAVSVDLKREGNLIYLIGETRREMAGSEYYRILGLSKGFIPKVNPEETREKMSSLLKAMDNSLVRSCHDLSTGGLLVAITEMSLGGDLGVELDLSGIKDLRMDFKLFSESNGRWLVEVEEKDAGEFRDIVDCRRIGEVVKEKEVRIGDDGIELNLSLNELRDRWDSAIEREV